MVHFHCHVWLPDGNHVEVSEGHTLHVAPHKLTSQNWCWLLALVLRTSSFAVSSSLPSLPGSGLLQQRDCGVFRIILQGMFFDWLRVSSHLEPFASRRGSAPVRQLPTCTETYRNISPSATQAPPCAAAPVDTLDPFLRTSWGTAAQGTAKLSTKGFGTAQPWFVEGHYGSWIYKYRYRYR